MKVVKKNVYYCEYCKKRSLAGGHMNTHEIHCTNNPNRKCRLCEGNYNIGEIVTELKTRFILEETIVTYQDEYISEDIKGIKAKWTGEPITLKEVRDKVDGCPNCMLAIIRQCKLAYYYFEDMGFEKFDYKKESLSAFSEKQSYDKYEYDYLRY